ncbi:MAG: DUF4142 domain-containing protein [Pseudomonas sp.]
MLRHRLMVVLLTLAATPLLAAQPAPALDSVVAHTAQAAALQMQAAEQALRQSQSADVKDFALGVIDSHSRNKADLEAFARSSNSALPDASSLAEQARNKVEQLPEEQFDAAYAASQVKSYEQTINLLAQAADHSGDSELQRFASARLPELKYQLVAARQLSRSHPLP